MQGRSRLILIVFLVLAAVFIAGLFNLFSLRFKTGDIYPPYSSLRSDPLGSKVFYQSLKQLPGIRVSRNYRELSRLQDKGDQTFLYLGVRDLDKNLFSRETFSFFEQLSSSGGRVIISPYPVTDLEGAGDKDADSRRSGCPGNGTASEEEKLGSSEDIRTARKKVPLSISRRWGVELARESERTLYATPDINKSGGSRMPEVFFPSSSYFENYPETWKVAYSKKDKPVIIYREFGEGEIVLLTGSYLFSNEALKKHSHAGFLTWIIGDSSHVVFDESHLGISKTPGVVSLIKKYDLELFFMVLALLAVLILWSKSAKLVPVTTESNMEAGTYVDAGRDNLAALVNMLKQSYSPREILRLSLTELKKSWRDSYGSREHLSTEKYQRAEEIIESELQKKKSRSSPVEAYKAIVNLFSEGKRNE